MQTTMRIFQHSPVGLLLFRRQEARPVCAIANEAAVLLLGGKKVLGEGLDALFSTGAARRLENAPSSTEYYESHGQRWLLAESAPVEEGFALSLTDITIQKESAIADKKLMNLYKTLSGALSDNEIILFDSDFNIIFTEGTPKFIRLNTDENFVGKNMKKVIEGGRFSGLGDYIVSVHKVIKD